MAVVQEAEGDQKVVRQDGRPKTLASHPGEDVTTPHQKNRWVFNPLFCQSNVAKYVQPFGMRCIVC